LLPTEPHPLAIALLPPGFALVCLGDNLLCFFDEV
jgi:hypothetical protein